MPSVKRLQHTSIPMPPGGDEDARAFYGEVLGMREIPKPEGLAAMTVVWFAANDDGDEVHVFKEETWDQIQRRSTSAWKSTISRRTSPVCAIMAMMSTVPETIYNRPRLFVRDPFDNLIELVEILGQYV